MIKKDYTISSADPHQMVHVVTWCGKGEPKAVLQIVHGMEEYIDRYDAQAEAMVALGWAVIGHDHLGHGRSGNHVRGHFTNLKNGDEILLADIANVSKMARELWPDAPQYIMGHSMGSFFVRRYLCWNSWNVEGAVIMGTGYYPPIATGTAWRAARLACKFHQPTDKVQWLTRLCSLPFLHAFEEEGPDSWLSRNPANNKAFRTDPLRGFGFTCGSYVHMYKILYDVSRHKDLNWMRSGLPLLIISGEYDPVGGKKAVDKLRKDLEERGYANVSSFVLPGDRHELYFESDADKVIQSVSKWLEAYRYTQERQEEKRVDKSKKYETYNKALADL